MRKPVFLARLHLSIRFPPAFEYRIPAYIGGIGQYYAYLEISSWHTKASWSSCRYYHALWNISLAPLYRLKRANRCSAFKDDRLMTRLLTICKRTNSLSTFVFVREKELVKALVPKGFEKPFTITRCQACALPIPRDRVTHMYGPGSPLSALKQRAVSSMSTGPPTFALNLAW